MSSLILRSLSTLLATAGLLLFAGAPRDAHADAPAGTFAAPPVFAPNGQATAVFAGGSIDQFEAAARASGAAGAWLQDRGGAFHLLVVGGPAFMRATITAAFSSGLGTATPVMLTRPP